MVVSYHDFSLCNRNVLWPKPSFLYMYYFHQKSQFLTKKYTLRTTISRNLLKIVNITMPVHFLLVQYIFPSLLSSFSILVYTTSRSSDRRFDKRIIWIENGKWEFEQRNGCNTFSIKCKSSLNFGVSIFWHFWHWLCIPR